MTDSRRFGSALPRSFIVTAALISTVALLLIVGPTRALAFNVKADVVKHTVGELDCNGYSPRQTSIKRTMACTDVRGDNKVQNTNVDDGRFYDNGHYIGHDEPDATFLSSTPGSGNNVTWTETLPKDPSAPPTVSTPGSDITHWFELSIAPWFSMAMCDSNSYPQLPCSAMSDANAPKCSPGSSSPCTPGTYPGAGGAFMEMQFYPPGYAPFADAISCDNTRWCAALNIDSLECTLGFASCNGGCEEPVNFAYIQRDGIPTGPPSPQETNLSTFTPNGHTLLMNPGDKLVVHMFDAAVAGAPGQRAFEVVIKDVTTGQSGFMQASAANGFQNTSIVDCSGSPYNFQPEYNTASKRGITPWAALQTNISTEYEIGHFTPCSSLSGRFSINVAPGITDTSWTTCNGPYEATADGGGNPEGSDANCFPAGDTHGSLNTAPNEVTGCLDFASGGDLDFDGTPYWADWPTGTTPGAFPSSFVQQLPQSQGNQYSSFFLQTDTALSESTCNGVTTAGCAIPAPGSPGGFFPYWTRSSGSSCAFLFGNVSGGIGKSDYGKDAQYGTDRSPTLGYPEFEGPVHTNTCTTGT
jgi:hypothetical protein